MRSGIVEIVGIFLTIVGACALVAAAAMVSTALAVLTAGVWLLLAGALAVYVAAHLEKAEQPDKPRQVTS